MQTTFNAALKEARNQVSRLEGDHQNGWAFMVWSARMGCWWQRPTEGYWSARAAHAREVATLTAELLGLPERDWTLDEVRTAYDAAKARANKDV